MNWYHVCFFFYDKATTEIYTFCHTLSLHDALPSSTASRAAIVVRPWRKSSPVGGEPTDIRTAWGLVDALTAKADAGATATPRSRAWESEEHTSELQSLMRISYAVFCLKKKRTQKIKEANTNQRDANTKASDN